MKVFLVGVAVVVDPGGVPVAGASPDRAGGGGRGRELYVLVECQEPRLGGANQLRGD